MEVDNNKNEFILPQLKTKKKSLQEGNGRPAVRTRQATKYLFKGFRILGINMPSKYKPLYILYSLMVNGLVTIWLPFSFAISYAKMSKEEDLEIANLLTSIQVAINVLGCSVKIVFMIFLLPKLRLAEEYMEKLDRRCRDDDEIAELHYVVRLGNRLVVLFAIAYWSYSTSTFLGATLMGRPPYAVYNPLIDWHKSTLLFWLASLIEFLLMDIACLQQVVDDSYAVIYVCILRTHMKILLLRVKKLGSRSELSLKQNIEQLKLCIKDHKNLVHGIHDGLPSLQMLIFIVLLHIFVFVIANVFCSCNDARPNISTDYEYSLYYVWLYNIISPIISITIFIQFMISASILSTTLINIFLFSTELSSQVASCFYILAVVVEIFPLCYYAQCMVDDSDNLAQAIFYSNWFEQNSSYRKMLIFFMQRSQRSMELSAGKIFPITLPSFLSIAKFSFSLYTFIKKMGIKEKLGLQ